MPFKSTRVLHIHSLFLTLHNHVTDDSFIKSHLSLS